MEPYGPRDITKVIARFIKSFPNYGSVTSQAKHLDDMVTEANGDARKALNLIYIQKMKEISRSQQFKPTTSAPIVFSNPPNEVAWKSSHIGGDRVEL